MPVKKFTEHAENILKKKRKSPKVPRIIRCKRTNICGDKMTIYFDRKYAVQLAGSIVHYYKYCSKSCIKLTFENNDTVSVSSDVHTIRHCRLFLVTDMMTDSCSIRKKNLYLCNYAMSAYLNDSTYFKHTFFRMILKFLCVNRLFQRGMISYDHFGFPLVTYLDKIVDLYSFEELKREDTHSEIRSFLQLDTNRIIAKEEAREVYLYMRKRKILKKIFKSAYTFLRMVMLSKGATTIKQEPLFAIYPICISPLVPRALKRKVMKMLKVKTNHIRPCKNKGGDDIECKNACKVYKRYEIKSSKKIKQSYEKLAHFVKILEVASFGNDIYSEKSIPFNVWKNTEKETYPIMHTPSVLVCQSWVVRWSEFCVSTIAKDLFKEDERAAEEIIVAHILSAC